MLDCLANFNNFRNSFRLSCPEELGLSFTISLTFVALLINDFRKFKNIIVMLISGIVATIGYNTIPFQAYIIVAAIAALLVATLLTLITLKKN